MGKNMDEAIACVKEGMGHFPESKSLLVLLTELYTYNEDFKALPSLYQKLIVMDPLDIISWIGLGSSLEYSGKYQKAKQAFESALKIDDKNESALEGLATCLISLNKIEEAGKLLNALVRTDRKNLNYCTLLARLYIQTNMFDDAKFLLQDYKYSNEGEFDIIDYLIDACDVAESKHRKKVLTAHM
eukprot:TRINITY_DN2760_c0_g1_i1.p1 TRINITY_DN2760_c0_g1~~TRINITY_DN2760_c0_g1_i1.p1  ORF type:complete len:186 (-),score=46.91 TRINITY_DN2760_c0_g1_i1:114-671(-)